MEHPLFISAFLFLENMRVSFVNNFDFISMMERVTAIYGMVHHFNIS